MNHNLAVGVPMSCLILGEINSSFPSIGNFIMKCTFVLLLKKGSIYMLYESLVVKAAGQCSGDVVLI